MSKTPTKNPAAVALGRLGGSVNTTAQNRARKQNAQLAGRPGRVCARCRQPVRGGHKDPTLDKTCGQHGWVWERAGEADAAPPDLARQLLREALDVFTRPNTSVVDVRDWTRAAKKFLK